MSVTGRSATGIPTILLHEAEGMVCTVEMKNGDTFRGLLEASEDSFNVVLSHVVHTRADGQQFDLENIYIRGDQLQFMILPDMCAVPTRSHGVARNLHAPLRVAGWHTRPCSDVSLRSRTAKLIPPHSLGAERRCFARHVRAPFFFVLRVLPHALPRSMARPSPTCVLLHGASYSPQSERGPLSWAPQRAITLCAALCLRAASNDCCVQCRLEGT